MMRPSRPGLMLWGSKAVSTALGLSLVLALTLGQQGPRAQEPADKAKVQEKGKAKPGVVAPAIKPAAKGGLRAGGGAPPKGLDLSAAALDPLLRSLARMQGVDPRAADPRIKLPDWPFHFTLKITGQDGIPLAATYYPSRARENAPVVLLIHATGAGHGQKDFEEPIEGLKKEAPKEKDKDKAKNPDDDKPRSLATALQDEDYAVLTIDLRGHGGSGLKQELTSRDWTALANDLHTAYLFLVDRHNRQELNLAKLGILAVGDGGNLAANWAAAPNGPVSGPGRVADLAALVIVSPVLEAEKLRLAPPVNLLAPQVPILLIGGQRDTETLQAAQKSVERNRLGKVTTLDTRLQAEVLIRLEPKVFEDVLKFLEEPVKFRANSLWQPRYLLTPTVMSSVEAVDPRKPKEAAKKEEAKKAEPKPEEPKKTETGKPKPAPNEANPKAEPAAPRS